MTGAEPVSALQTTGYGALAGGLVGAGLSLVLVGVWAVTALGTGGSKEAAFGITALLSGIVSFPALLLAPPDLGAGHSLGLAQLFVFGLPCATWLVVGTLSGVATDVVRAIQRRF